MAVELADLVDPASTGVVTSEVQNGVVGAQSLLPALADAARPVLPAIGRLVGAARSAGVQVVHATVHRRQDGKGTNRNARLFLATARAPVQLLPGSDAAAVVDAVGVEPEDLVLARTHGISPMTGTELDPVLRNLGISTVVVAGASLNIAVTNLVMDAVNRGYQVVLPRDAVVGIPDDYARAMLDNTLGLLATLTTVDELVDVWKGRT